jgi:DNA polymerase III delta prime subunit
VIVEFFGPPGSGKTTFAHALSEQLRQDGCAVDVYLSARPGEECSGSTVRGHARVGQGLIDPLHRLARPLAQLIALKTSGSRRVDTSTEALVANFPQRHKFTALRMRQYLVRLSAAWRHAGDSEHVTIFDQGYVQAVSSILLVRGRTSEADAAEMLFTAPPSDLAIRVEVPPTEIARRLRRREIAIGRFGRLFESYLGEPTQHARVANWLESELQRAGRATLSVNSTDPETLTAELARTRAKIDHVRPKKAAELEP